MRTLLAVGAAALLASVPAASQPKSMVQLSIDAQTIADLLTAKGLETSIGTDGVGDPAVFVTPGKGHRAEFMQVIFFDCNRSGACLSLTMVSFYATSSGIDVTNAWNLEGRWTRAYINADSEAVLEMDINAEGGLTEDALGILVNHYLEALPLFGRHVGS